MRNAYAKGRTVSFPTREGKLQGKVSLVPRPFVRSEERKVYTLSLGRDSSLLK